MNILGWLLSLSIMVTILIQAVNLHKATVCRQEAWLKSTELKTGSLLPGATTHATRGILKCRVEIRRHGGHISWQRYPKLLRHTFNLPLQGKL